MGGRKAFAWAGGLVAVACAGPAAHAEWIVPIAGHSPQVVLSLTTERDPDDLNFSIINDTTYPASDTLPLGGSPHFVIATYDTGAAVTIIDRDAYTAFDLDGADKDGAFPTLVNGVQAIASDPLGTYVGGFGTVTGTSPLAADTAAFKGQYNSSILYAPPGTTLPNVVGTPVSSQYTTVFDYADPQIITTGGVEYRSPEVTLSTFGAVPNPSRRVQLNVTAGQLGDPPAFFASFANLQDFGDDPAAPTVGPFYALDADVSHDGNLRTGLDMGYDSGSQGTFVSEQVAATLGFDVVNDTPDFVVRLQTVTGQVDEVPGFIADQFTLPGTDGGLVLTDVPLIVFNLPDPRSAGNILDGLVGQNLFANRTVTLDPEPATGLGDPGPYLGLSGQALDNHDWASAAAAADFAAASSWTGAGNPAVDWIAHVESAAAFDQVANLAADASVSALNVVGDADRMAVAVQTGATLTVFGTAIVTGNGELRMAGGTVSTLAVEVRSGGHLTGEGTVAGEVIVLGNLTPGASAGVLHFADNLDLLASSTTTIELGGTSNAGPTQFDQVLVDQTSTVGGTLSLVVIGGYDPALGDAADILVADGGLAGTFDAVTGVSVDAGRSLAVTYLTDRVRVTAARPADANLDGAVNFSDFLLLQAAFGGKGTWADGDFNGSGGIDFSDFLVLQANFGAGAALAPAELSQQLAALAAFAEAHGPAPEPAAAAVLALAAPVLLGRRPRHNPATGG